MPSVPASLEATLILRPQAMMMAELWRHIPLHLHSF